MLGCGGYHVGRNESEREAQAIVETAIEGGVRFFDNSESYQAGGAETRYGRYLTPRYREHVFLMTKTDATDAAGARRSLDASLRRLKTDYLDLWQMHQLMSPGDVEGRLQGGVLDVMQEAKSRGKVRHIGFTGHASFKAHARMLALTDDLETCQMPVNVLDPSHRSFVVNVLPTLVGRKMGILAMKTLADGRFFASTRSNRSWRSADPVIPGRISVGDALSFAWSLPVSVVISGADNAAMLREKIELARTFQPLSEDGRRSLVARVADLSDGRVEYFKKEV